MGRSLRPIARGAYSVRRAKYLQKAFFTVAPLTWKRKRANCAPEAKQGPLIAHADDHCWRVADQLEPCSVVPVILSPSTVPEKVT
jgi:hypothetical protein